MKYTYTPSFNITSTHVQVSNTVAINWLAEMDNALAGLRTQSVPARMLKSRYNCGVFYLLQDIGSDKKLRNIHIQMIV